jgi:ubiquitin-protein ligase
VYIQGVDDTPYAGGRCPLNVVFPTGYSLRAPSIVFQKLLDHPSVHQVTGKFCLDILTKDYKHVMRMSEIFMVIYFLIASRLPDSAVDTQIAEELRTNPDFFNKKARECTQRIGQ